MVRGRGRESRVVVVRTRRRGGCCGCLILLLLVCVLVLCIALAAGIRAGWWQPGTDAPTAYDRALPACWAHLPTA